MEQTGYQIVHAIVGRIRIRISWLETDSEAASKLQRLVESLSFVTSARINPLASSIVISYKPRNMPIDEAQERFVDAIQEIKLTPLIVPPPPPEPPRETAPPTPDASDASVWVDIPSPWDDPIEKTSPIDHPPEQNGGGKSIPIEDPPAAELVEVHADPDEPDVSNPPQQSIDLSPHTTALLAQRLGVTSQAITRRRSKPDFATWSQAQDPEHFAWHYDADSRSFHAIAADLLS